MNSIVPDNSQPDNSLHTFNLDQWSIRVVINDSGEPLFIAADVCRALGIINTSDAVSGLDDDQKGTIASADRGYSQQNLLYVTESGLYDLIFKSRKPEARSFQRWVTNEVLPSIRRTGVYLSKVMSPAELILAQAQRLVEYEAQIKVEQQKNAEQDQRLDAVEARIEARNEYFTVLGYCRYRKLPAPSNTQAIQFGRQCAALSRSRGVAVGQATDVRLGTVNTYHESILKEIIEVKS